METSGCDEYMLLILGFSVFCESGISISPEALVRDKSLVTYSSGINSPILVRLRSWTQSPRPCVSASLSKASA